MLCIPKREVARYKQFEEFMAIQDCVSRETGFHHTVIMNSEVFNDTQPYRYTCIPVYGVYTHAHKGKKEGRKLKIKRKQQSL